MPDDRLRELFDHAASVPVDVPPVDRVLARGQQRRRRARLQASTIAWTIMLAAGFGAPQVSGGLAQGTARYAPFVPSAGAPQASSYPRVRAAGTTPGPTATSAAPSRTHVPVSPKPSPTGGNTTYHAAATLPPSGRGQLILGLDRAHTYVMTRIGSAGTPVRVTGLQAVAGAPPVLATNPSGGWVVTFASGSRARDSAPARLALVATSGHSVPFGPMFGQATVTSAAVSRDGSRVAVAVAWRTGGARIEVLPLPGHQVARRSWSVPSAQAEFVTDLSWSPDGRRLSYLAGQSASQGSAAGPVILDTTAKVTAVPQLAGWPLTMKTGVTCVSRAAAWLGTSGEFAVLSECLSTGVVVLQTSDASTGAAVGQPIVVTHQTGCGRAALNSNAAGSMVLISYCGVYLDHSGTLSRESAALTAAALSG